MNTYVAGPNRKEILIFLDLEIMDNTHKTAIIGRELDGLISVGALYNTHLA